MMYLWGAAFMPAFCPRKQLATVGCSLSFIFVGEVAFVHWSNDGYAWEEVWVKQSTIRSLFLHLAADSSMIVDASAMTIAS